MPLVDSLSLDGAQVLIVDDTPTNIEVLYRLLESEPYQIVVANCGERAIKIALDSPPDLILLDVVMPGMDGLETCARIKREPSLQEVPIIFVTGKAEASDMLRGFHVGGVDYITKPFLEEEVRARVRTQVNLRYHCKERMRLLEVERRQGKYLQTIVNNVSDGILRTDERGHLITLNPAVERMFGYRADELQGQPLSSLMVEPYATEYSGYFTQEAGVNTHSIDHGRREIVGCRKDGSNFSFDFSIVDMYAEQHVYIGILHDIGLPRDLEKDSMQVQSQEAPGDIAGSLHFQSLLQKEWARARRNKISVALLLVEPDAWQDYLDQHGLNLANQALKRIGSALSSFAKRPADFVAYRESLGFFLLLPDTGRGGAKVVAERLCLEVKRIAMEYPEAAAAVVTISVGVKVMIPESALETSSLLTGAEQALQEAQRLGGNCVV